MLAVEGGLIEGRPPRYVQIPTAAGQEGRARLAYWVELGRAQAQRLGVEPVPLVVVNREQADDPAVADQVEGAGLIYLSGGNPAFLADTLRDTALWAAILRAWRAGSALAGCSAGAMAMADRVPDMRRAGTRWHRGLGLLPHIRVLPHFDRMLGRAPHLFTGKFLQGRPGGEHLVGIDEDTALVGGPEAYTVEGKRSAWLLADGQRQEYPAGTRLDLPAATAGGPEPDRGWAQ
jgi:cyanophycinase-like exopeptidase